MNWYEGAASYTPSTNNALESHNAVIKRTATMRQRLPLKQFLTCISNLLIDITRQFMSGTRTIENKPSVNKNLLEKAALMQQQNFVAIKAKSTIPTYIIPSSTCPKELANKKHYAALFTTQWSSFDTYINHGYQFFWIAQISAESWDTQSTCTCPAFFKHNKFVTFGAGFVTLWGGFVLTAVLFSVDQTMSLGIQLL